MSGTVILDEFATNEPLYWIWQFVPNHHIYEYWTSVHMTLPPGEVRTYQITDCAIIYSNDHTLSKLLTNVQIVIRLHDLE